MRLPALAIAVAFAYGIVLSLHPAVVHNASSVALLLSILFVAQLFVLSGIVLVKLDWLFPPLTGNEENWRKRFLMLARGIRCLWLHLPEKLS